MILSINQPAYLPWLGYFDRINKSDVHVVLDHVQFEKGSFTNRNKILTKNGPAWVTIPAIRKKGLSTSINEVEINNSTNWKEKHKNTIFQAYKNKPCADYMQDFLNFYNEDWNNLISVLEQTTDYLLKKLSIETIIKTSSAMELNASKSDLVLEICKSLEADKYLSGPLGRDYLEISKFHSAGIEVLFHDYEHPKYQQGNDMFVENMSIIDLLFNHGEDSVNILNTAS